MATPVSTTLAAALTATAKEIKVASATSFAAGRLIRVNDEWMKVLPNYVSASTLVPVLRGQLGSFQVAHPSGAGVTHGAPEDFGDNPAQDCVILPFHRVTRIVSYGATGAIELPKPGEDLRVILNGTTVCEMTIADPGKELNGCELSILADGTAAHTLTFASGLGGESTGYDVLTYNSGGPVALKFVACGGYWHLYAGVAITGTVTNLTAGIA